MKWHKHRTQNGLQLDYGRAYEVPDGTEDDIAREMIEKGKAKDLGPFYCCHRCRGVYLEKVDGPAAGCATVANGHVKYTCHKCVGTGEAKYREKAIQKQPPKAERKAKGKNPCATNDSLFG